MKTTRQTIRIHARKAGVGATVSRGRQMFQVDAEPNEVLSGRILAERFAKKIKVDVSEANYIIESLQEFILEELRTGNRLDFELMSFLPRLSGTLSARDASPVDEGLELKGHVKERPALRNALKGRLVPVNATSPEWGAIQSVMDEVLKKFDQIAIGHEIGIAGVNVQVDVERPDEGVWLEDAKGNVASRAEVTFSDAQVLNCRFTAPVAPGAYTLVLANRAGKKGTDYKLCRHCRSVTVV